MTGLLYPLAVIRAFFTKQHEWRGIVYRVEGRGITTIRENDEFSEAGVGQHESI